MQEKESRKAGRIQDVLRLQGTGLEAQKAWTRIEELLHKAGREPLLQTLAPLPLVQRFERVLQQFPTGAVHRMARYALLAEQFTAGVGHSAQAEALFQIWERCCKSRLLARHLFGLVDRTDQRVGQHLQESLERYLAQRAGLTTDIMNSVRALPEGTRRALLQGADWDEWVGRLSLELAEIVAAEIRSTIQELRLQRFDAIDFEQDVGLSAMQERIARLRSLAAVIEKPLLQQRLLAVLQLSVI